MIVLLELRLSKMRDYVRQDPIKAKKKQSQSVKESMGKDASHTLQYRTFVINYQKERTL